MSSVSPSTTCYQALQSCSVEPRVLRLRLAPPIANIPPSSSSSGSDPEPAVEPNNNAGGFSFLQCINAKETGQIINKDQQVFTKRSSSSSLSKQSLEMCTESLGSETGSDDHDDVELLLLPPLSNAAADSEEQEDVVVKTSCVSGTASRQRVRNTRRRSGSSLMLPPPLSSIGGSTGVQMRSHREDGRLVVTAVEVPSSRTKFHAERTNGRLRLHLTTEYPAQVQEAEEEKTEDGETEEEKEGDEEWGEEMEEEVERANSGINARSGRCKDAGDGNRGLMNWEPFWVAT